jgi:hypothetical protein
VGQPEATWTEAGVTARWQIWRWHGGLPDRGGGARNLGENPNQVTRGGNGSGSGSG